MYKTGAIPKTRRQEERRKRALIVYFLTGAFVALGFISLLWSVPRFPQTLISSVTVEGNQLVSQESILREVSKKLNGSKMIFFPNANIFFAPTEDISKQLLAEFPRILTASVERSGLDSLNIKIVERGASALVCKEEGEAVSCFNADSESVLYAISPDYHSSAIPKFFVMSSTSVLRINDQFLLPVEFNSFLKLVEDLKRFGLSTERINIFEDSSEVHTENGILILTKEQNMQIAFENFKSLVESEDFKEKSLDSGKFQYIDLRFGNKLFYKI